MPHIWAISCSRGCPVLQKLASGQAWQRSPCPAELAFRFLYLVIVDRGVAAAHQAVLVELPQLITVTSPPLPLHVVALVLEPYRDAVICEAPEVLFESVVELASPLALQEVPDCLAALEELVAVAPLRIFGVGECDLLGVAGVPSVLCHLHLLSGALLVEGW